MGSECSAYGAGDGAPRRLRGGVVAEWLRSATFRHVMVTIQTGARPLRRRARRRGTTCSVKTVRAHMNGIPFNWLLADTLPAKWRTAMTNGGQHWHTR